MHELGMCASILDVVEKRAGQRRVSEVKVRIGVLHRVSEEAFVQSFSLASEGTIAEGAKAEMVMIPVECRCLDCSKTFSGDEVIPWCKSCGSDDIEVVSGDEFVLESLTYAK